MPLYSRLSAADQHKVFSSHPSTVRRVVLATNVAETSLTVPGIRYVVDTGVARISRYSVRTKVQRLPIEPISQASANQRSGRCGRVARASRSGSTRRRTSRAARSSPTPRSCAPTWPASSSRWPRCGLGDIARFPFVEPPDRRNVKAGTDLLEELGARPRAQRRRRRGPTDVDAASPRSASAWPGSRSTRASAG